MTVQHNARLDTNICKKERTKHLKRGCRIVREQAKLFVSVPTHACRQVRIQSNNGQRGGVCIADGRTQTEIASERGLSAVCVHPSMSVAGVSGLCGLGPSRKCAPKDDALE